MPIKDLLGLSQPLVKLIEVISAGVGRVSKHYFDKLDANAKAFEIEKIADARGYELKTLKNALGNNADGSEVQIESQKVSLKTVINDPDLNSRVASRIGFHEMRKQFNLERITSMTAENLRSEESVSDEPVNEDWSVKFFNIASEVSTEELQLIWAKILAGEIRQPHSYSLRTLETVKNLSKSEAQTFMKISNAVVYQPVDYAFLFIPGGSEELIGELFGISFDDILEMRDIGILSSQNVVVEINAPLDVENRDVFVHGNIGVVITRPPKLIVRDIPAINFTRVGREMLQLTNPSPSIEYLKRFSRYISHDQKKISCEIGAAIRQGGRWTVPTPKPFDLSL
jgi:hypothetical protein